MFDELLDRNRAFSRDFAPVPLGPSLGLVVVTCVDTRVHPSITLGLDRGEAFVVRTVGGRVAGAIDDLHAIAAMAGGPLPVLVMHHTDCGTARLASELTDEVAAATGRPTDEVAAIAVTDPRESVRADVAAVAEALECVVGGYVYDVETGLVDEVVAPATA